MNVVFETDRLLLREFTLNDARILFELNGDPEVTRYTGDPMKDLDLARQVLEEVILPQYILYNYGRWAVHLKQSLAFIGWCGLKFRPWAGIGKVYDHEIDLGYRFKRSEWGKGYATESAWACIKYGFEKKELTRIIGRAMPENLASLKVLKNCGMSYVGEGLVDGHQAITYEIFNPLIR